MGARAGPSVGGYGSAALFLISPASHPIPRGPMAVSPALVARLFGTVRRPAAVRRHPKVRAGWNIAVERSLTRRCYTSMPWAMRRFDLAAASSRNTTRRLRPLARCPGRRAVGRLLARR
jgi:hypothetical protein